MQSDKKANRLLNIAQTKFLHSLGVYGLAMAAHGGFIYRKSNGALYRPSHEPCSKRMRGTGIDREFVSCAAMLLCEYAWARRTTVAEQYVVRLYGPVRRLYGRMDGENDETIVDVVTFTQFDWVRVRPWI